ncbi:MAG TPA: hypothetical protein VK399_10015, partial [Longimicrobiaceae bacterium]|nr:hypothetical protein [Longimicrobiaceae bacterium]
GYLNARMVVSATQGYLQALQKDVARQDSAVARARAALGAAERAASDSLRKALKEHTSRRRGLNFVCGLVLALVAFGTLWVAAPWLARRLEVPLHPGLAFGVGGAVLLVLVAHHLLRWTGALGVVSLLALGWLAHAVRHHPRPAPGTEGQR